MNVMRGSGRGGDDPNRREQVLAFVSDDTSESIVRAVIAELMVPFANVQRGDAMAAGRYLASHRSPRILIVDLSRSDLPVSTMAGLADVCEPGVAVLAIGDRNDVGLFRDLIGLGISDYLVKPLSRDLLSRALGGLLEGRPETTGTGRGVARTGRVVAVVGARGGVGTTTVAVNLAWSLAEGNARRVALLDLDLHQGSAALMLDVKPGPALREAILNPDRIDAQFIERATARHGERLFVIAGEEAFDDDIPLASDGVSRLVGALKSQFHYVVVDMPDVTQSGTQQVLAEAAAVVVVGEPSLAGARDCTRITNMIRIQTPRQRVLVAVNRIGAYRRGELSEADFEKALGRPVDVRIAFDPVHALEDANLGHPAAARSGSLASGVRRLIDEIGGSPAAGVAQRGGGWFTRLLPGARA